MVIATEIEVPTFEVDLVRQAKRRREDGSEMTITFATPAGERTVTGIVRSILDQNPSQDGKPGRIIVLDTGGPLELAEIKRRYEDGTLARPHALEELARRGLPETDAEDQLSDWQMGS
ncbi:MAG TPA: hypothetical protein VFQ52_03810 [Rhizomicrobium sp.]|nr:hypothetical protein [Rhizomicrobium sp.]